MWDVMPFLKDVSESLNVYVVLSPGICSFKSNLSEISPQISEECGNTLPPYQQLRITCIMILDLHTMLKERLDEVFPEKVTFLQGPVNFMRLHYSKINNL